MTYFLLVKLEADKVDDVMKDFLTLTGVRNCRIYFYRSRSIRESPSPNRKGRPENLIDNSELGVLS